ncbi:MAG: TRAP transporter fused permease subunit [Candidatus Poribacteria bacterium]|nr:TRAP transporter fused permease subunit [Candidatus Poribacteria bacterium]
MKQIRQTLILPVAVLLSLFILVEVNYPLLKPQSALAIFAMLGLIVVFLKYPFHPRFAENRFCQILDFVLAGSVIICFGYVAFQTEPIFERFWLNGKFLGNRASAEHILDYFIAGLGLILILEATRRAIGLTLPLLTLVFLLYAFFGQFMPNWLFQHRGHSLERVLGQTFLHGGVFGVALRVMFTYVFLFVLFGTLLERTGATGYILNLAKRIFGTSAGSPAKVAVIGSGMMGSLSGSAVANTATTGTFTIPLMRSVGFKPTIAGGIEAAASSGGALVPPIMGAAAYMMLEIVEPSVTYLEIIKAALLPAILYYTALLLIVHFYAKRIGNTTANQTEAAEPTEENAPIEKLPKMQGVVFFGAFVTLILFLLKLPGAAASETANSPWILTSLGFILRASTPFRAVSWSLLVVLVISLFHRQTRVGISGIIKSMENAAHSGVSLVAAASCVGIILGVVTLTGVGSKLLSVLLPLAETNLILALFLLMISTIILGMGLPSSVCYLLTAILVGDALLDLGVVPLAAHFFIFYFGMMSMVTPPVALAAYTAAAIADANIMKTAFAAFRFALVGFALPYAFVLRPELLLLNTDGSNPEIWAVIINLLPTLAGTVILAASIAGYAFKKLLLWERYVMFIAVAILFFIPTEMNFMWLHGITLLASVSIFYYNWRKKEVNHENYA